MLSIAISSFFAVALLGSATVIAMMFLQYRDRIVSVIENELQTRPSETASPSSACRLRTVKVPQPMASHRSMRPVPLRVAA
mgnify:CR=1 FL=1